MRSACVQAPPSVTKLLPSSHPSIESQIPPPCLPLSVTGTGKRVSVCAAPLRQLLQRMALDVSVCKFGHNSEPF